MGLSVVRCFVFLPFGWDLIDCLGGLSGIKCRLVFFFPSGWKLIKKKRIQETTNQRKRKKKYRYKQIGRNQLKEILTNKQTCLDKLKERTDSKYLTTSVK